MGKEINSKTLADVLLADYITGKQIFNPPLILEIKEDQASYFEEKVVLYKLALVLMALITKENKEPKFAKVREYLEILTFPAAQEEAFQFLEEVRSAMGILEELLSFVRQGRSAQGMYWAKALLNKIGIIEDNPVNLALFAHVWVQSFIAISNCLQEFDPQ